MVREDDPPCKSKHPVGIGKIVLEGFNGTFHLSKLSFLYPLKLVAPRATRQCQSVFILSYGGGLVGGDAIHIDVVLKPRTTLALMTQGSTKIFKGRAGLPATKQSLNVSIGCSAMCILIPDPVQPFADSSYIQDQCFKLETNANLIVLDWFLSGRPANGEVWDFNEFRSTNSIVDTTDTANRLLCRDAQILRKIHMKSQMKAYHCFATLLMTGPLTLDASQKMLGSFKNEKRLQGTRMRTQNDLIYTVTTHRNVTLLKVVGISSEQIKLWLSEAIDSFGWRHTFGSEPFRALE